MLSDSRISYKATLMKTVWYRFKDRKIYQNKQNQARNSPTYIRKIDLWQRCNGLLVGGKIESFLQMLLEQLDNGTLKKFMLCASHKNSKYIIDLNVKLISIKFINISYKKTLLWPLVWDLATKVAK